MIFYFLILTRDVLSVNDRYSDTAFEIEDKSILSKVRTMKNKILLGVLIVIIILVVTLIVINLKDGNNDTNQDRGINTSEEINGDDLSMKINLTINGNSFTATLEDNETTRELLNRLPIEVSMSELNGNEKYYYFDESLPTNSYRPRNISTGDIMLYGSDCLVIFYENFDTPYSYTRIGKIDNVDNLKDALGNGNVNVMISK